MARLTWKKADHYVWCDVHGQIHRATGDPFDEAHVNRPTDCTPSHRPVAVLTDDPSEEF